MPLEIAVVGTGTGVGKTRLTSGLVRALRARGRRVWVHKPVACGGWDGTTADDGRALAALAGDGQSVATICPLQFAEAASPHLAARVAGAPIDAAELRRSLARCRGDHDLVVEGAGGLLTPLADDRSGIVELLLAAGIAVVIAARADLGTINHTALTVAEARRRGLRVRGIVVSHVTPDDGSMAVRTAPQEIAALTGMPVLAVCGYGADAGVPLAEALLAV